MKEKKSVVSTTCVYVRVSEDQIMLSSDSSRFECIVSIKWTGVRQPNHNATGQLILLNNRVLVGMQPGRERQRENKASQSSNCLTAEQDEKEMRMKDEKEEKIVH